MVIQKGDNKSIYELCDVFLMMESRSEVLNFLKDLCTPNEISALAERWRVCRLVSDGEYSYREISKLTGASLTTISRVARFLKDEPYNGYENMLKKIKSRRGAK